MCDTPAKRQSKTSKEVKMSPKRPKESTSSHEIAESGICIFVSMPDGNIVSQQVGAAFSRFSSSLGDNN